MFEDDIWGFPTRYEYLMRLKLSSAGEGKACALLFSLWHPLSRRKQRVLSMIE
jgi:hypothetical protein